MKVAVLKVQPPFDFIPENSRTGLPIRGFKVTYIPLGLVRPDRCMGVPFVLVKNISNVELHNEFLAHEVPAVYDFLTQQSYNSKNELIEVITSVKFDRALKIEDLK